MFLEQLEGYVKPQYKSTSPPSTMKEVFEHGARDYLLRPLDKVAKRTRLEPLSGVCAKFLLKIPKSQDASESMETVHGFHGIRHTVSSGRLLASSEIFQPSRCEEDIVKCQNRRMFEQMSPGDRSFKGFCQVRLLGSPRKLELGWRFLTRGTPKAV